MRLVKLNRSINNLVNNIFSAKADQIHSTQQRARLLSQLCYLRMDYLYPFVFSSSQILIEHLMYLVYEKHYLDHNHQYVFHLQSHHTNFKKKHLII